MNISYYQVIVLSGINCYTHTNFKDFPDSNIFLENQSSVNPATRSSFQHAALNLCNLGITKIQ